MVSLTRPSNEPDQLGRTSSIVTDGNDVIKSAILLFNDPVEYINKAIGGGAFGVVAVCCC